MSSTTWHGTIAYAWSAITPMVSTVQSTLRRSVRDAFSAGQLTPAYRAFIIIAGALISMFGHVGSSNDNCPAHRLKMLSKPAGWPGGSRCRGETLRNRKLP